MLYQGHGGAWRTADSHMGVNFDRSHSISPSIAFAYCIRQFKLEDRIRLCEHGFQFTTQCFAPAVIDRNIVWAGVDWEAKRMK